MEVLVGLKLKQCYYVMRFALQKEKSSTSGENELLGGANGERKKATAVVQLREAESLGKERSGQILKIFLGFGYSVKAG